MIAQRCRVLLMRSADLKTDSVDRHMTKTMQEREQTLNLEQYLTILRRRGLLIALCIIVVGAGAFFYSRQQTKQYTATASLVFNGNQVSQEVAGLQAVATSDPATQQNTNLQLLTLGPMAAQTAQSIGGRLTASEVKGSTAVSAQGQSNVVKVGATWTSPEMAARIANTYATQFVADQLAASQGYFAAALALVQKQLIGLSPQQRVAPQGLALQDRAQSLGILSHLQASNVQVAQAANVPTSPSSPNVLRDTTLGLVLGLMLGLGLAFLLERLDRRIREPRDFERIYRLPLLGVIPASAALSQHTDDAEGASRALPPQEAEVFHMLRAHLRYFNVDRDVRTLVVASAAPGDGKTTVARNLAEAAAMMGSRVLLIEADLRRPKLGKALSITSTAGLAGVLIGAVSISDAIATVEVDPRRDNGHSSSGHSLDVLIAGNVAPPNPAALLESAAMRDLLASVRSQYEVVIIDTPPLTAVSDAFPLLTQVDGVIIVGRIGRNRRDIAARLHEILKGIDAPLLGVVANDFKQGRLDSYGYGYGYGNGYHTDSRTGADSAQISQNGDHAAPAPRSVGGD
jgi:tyrosine-protein kinase